MSGFSGASSPSHGRTLELEDAMHCTCGEKLQMKTSQTFKNPGRRFLVCPKDIVRGCKFFRWVDPSYPDQAKKVIKELMDEKSKLYSYNAELRSVIDKLKDEYQGNISMLEGELLLEKSKNVERKWLKGVCVCLAVVIVVTWGKLLV